MASINVITFVFLHTTIDYIFNRWYYETILSCYNLFNYCSIFYKTKQNLDLKCFMDSKVVLCIRDVGNIENDPAV